MQPIIEKQVVLAGAGNAHLTVLKHLAMHPLPRVAFTLVNDRSVSPYSAMVPGVIGGDYRRDEAEIDLSRLCQSAGVRLIVGTIESMDASRRCIKVPDRPSFRYDVLSVSLGSRPWQPNNAHSGSMRPLDGVIDEIERIDSDLKENPRKFHLVVVGGGASGCEVALAIHKRLKQHSGFHLSIVQSHNRLVPQFPARASRLLLDACRNRGITVVLDESIADMSNDGLMLDSGRSVPCDSAIWATNAKPSTLMATSGFALDAHGFLLVNNRLQSLSHPEVFGTGDGVGIDALPLLAKNGVHAVRQGRVLWTNIKAFLEEKPLVSWQPQKVTLSLLNTADGNALATWGPIAFTGRWLRFLKDRIDRRWVDMFASIKPGMREDGANIPVMRCGGCGSKVSSNVLSAVLKTLDTGTDPRIVLGAGDGEDASVHLMTDGLYGESGNVVEVQTVDYFKSFVHDPYLFGRIAALHAVSDIFAMNARPFCALAIATVPYARGPVQEDLLGEMLSGAVRELKALGVVLSGGHTTEGQELALGLAVTGHGERDRLFRKSGLHSGDRLILTKPVGTGAIMAASMRGACKAAWFDAAVRSMLQPNANASRICADYGVIACTDVTGFGLAGHLLEMLDASGCNARLMSLAVPVLDGFNEVAAEGILSTLHPDNYKMASRFESYIGALPEWLFDPQTSGGLLVGVSNERSHELLKALKEAGCDYAAVIGTVEPSREGSPAIRIE
jgi:selenide,water dikinase